MRGVDRVLLEFVGYARNERADRRAGMKCGGCDVEVASIKRQRPRETLNRELAGIIGDGVRPRDFRRQRADIDDPPATLLLHHAERFARTEEGRGEVRVEHLPPAFKRKLVSRRIVGYA